MMLHLLMPSSAGLFSSAAVQSGGFYQQSMKSALGYSRSFFNATGCNQTDVSCRDALPLSKILQVQRDLGGGPMPAVDGLLLSADPIALLQRVVGIEARGIREA